MACLISGPLNRVAIYETKAGKIKLVASENFSLIPVQEEMASPAVDNEHSLADKSKTSHMQAVTCISFNPRHALTVFMTGPNCRIDCTKIDRNDLVR